MKKIVLLAATFALAAMGANAQYVTKALNDDGESTFKWANASDFVPVIVGEAEGETMTGKIKLDMRPDDQTKHLYVWDNTFVAGDGSGMNSFGQLEDHFAMKVGTVGWSGLGVIKDGATDFSFLDDTYMLHFGIKGDPTNPLAIGIGDAKFTIGDNAFIDNGKSYKVLGTFKNDGEWYYVDIPFSVIKTVAGGTVFADANGGAKAYKNNFFWLLAGGTQGKEVHLDNIFFYKDKTLAPVTTKGDVNGDGTVNVADVTALVNVIAGAQTSTAADINGDGTVNVADVTALVNLIAGN